MMRYCGCCRVVLDVTAFDKNNLSCRPCLERQRDNYKKKRTLLNISDTDVEKGEGYYQQLHSLEEYRVDATRTGHRLTKHGVQVRVYSRPQYLFEAVSTELAGPQCGRCGKEAIAQLKDEVHQDSELVCCECMHEPKNTRPSSTCRYLIPATRVANPIAAFENLLILTLSNQAATEEQRVDTLVRWITNSQRGSYHASQSP